MAVNPTFPGVYIEELPSGVHTITGVATSIAAFVGWATQGPTSEAGLVLSWADYERTYGGLDTRSYLSYAVYQFFTNGGTQAYVVRLAAANAATAAVTIDGKLTLTANGPGLWANSYGIMTRIRTGTTDRFSVTVVSVNGTTETPVETFVNLSMAPTDSRYVVTVINSQSNYVTAAIVGAATTPPADTAVPSPKLSGGLDGDVLDPVDGAAAFDTALQISATSGGIHLLEHVDLFNLLCVPGESTPATIALLQGFCRAHRAFMIVDCARDDTFTTMSPLTAPDSSITGDDSINSAFYFPWINAPDPAQENRPKAFPPCGFVAGLYARTDANRGVWKAPAGTEASLTGVTGVSVPLNDPENGILNPKAINCIRNFAVYGTIIWGARTLQGNDVVGSQWKYVPVRRFALFLEESLFRALKWVVFEPNDEPLWAQIRLNVGAFLHNLFVQGAFQGQTPQEAYFVKVDKETTTQNDIDLGIVNIVVGFAPLKPAEFVIIQIQQMAGQIQV
jgi:uncharacterized protein